MQEPTPQPPSAEEPGARADLSRLRIPRQSAAARGSGGFPLLRLLVLAGVLVLAFLFKDPLLALVGGGTQVRTAKAVRVVPGQATAGDVAANGYIVADTQASLASVLSGRLVELHAAEGDIVEADAVVARIQYDDYEVEAKRAAAAVDSAVARVAQARSRTATAEARVQEAASDVAAAKLTSARLVAEVKAQEEVSSQALENVERLEREVERNRSLHDQKLIDSGEWDRIQTAARTAKLLLLAARARVRASEAAEKAWSGQIAKREAALAVARSDRAASVRGEAVAAAGLVEAQQSASFADIQLEKTRIRAPFRGLVIRKDAEKGEVIAPTGAGNSRGSVLTIVDPESLEVQVELSERRIARVKEGDRASVFLNAAPDERLPGRVRKIWPRADRSTGSIEVRVRLDNRPPSLRPDMAARVVFRGEEKEAEVGAAYVTVPRAALTKRDGADVAFVVEDGRVRRVRLVLGEGRGGMPVVTTGLSGGETVVLDPAADLADGDEVATDQD